MNKAYESKQKKNIETIKYTKKRKMKKYAYLNLVIITKYQNC